MHKVKAVGAILAIVLVLPSTAHSSVAQAAATPGTSPVAAAAVLEPAATGTRPSASVAQAAASRPGAPSWVKVEKKSTTSLKVWWAKVPGASGYVVYRWDSKKKRYVAVKTLTKASATVWIDKKRKTGKKYSYKVAAYRKVAGKKVVGPQSYWVSAVAYKKNAKVVNAGSLTSRNTAVGLSVSASLLLSDQEHCPLADGACVIPSKGSKAKNKRVVDTTVRLKVVSGKDVVRVTSAGVVHGLRVGKARIRVFAHNGAMKNITVTVKDYVHDPFKYTDYRAGSAERILLQSLGKQVQDVAAVAEQLSLKDSSFAGGAFFYDERGDLTCVVRKYWDDDDPGKPCPGESPKALVTAIDRLLDAFVFPMEIVVVSDPYSFVVVYRYWLTPDRSDFGGSLAYDPTNMMWAYDIDPDYVAPNWKWKLRPAE